MSAVDVTERPATPRPPVPGWMLVLFAWLVMIVLVGGFGPFRGEGWRPMVGDDAWRMVEVQDLAKGQGWYDTMQYRGNAPEGLLMHWSRLIDAPLAGLYDLFRPVYGDYHALDAAASLWPLLLLLVFLTLVTALAQRLGGPAARIPTLAVVLLTTVVYDEFSPGRVDHHNVQMILVVALMLTTVMGRRSVVAAATAGLVAATSIGIAIESLPSVVAALFAFALFWVFDPAAARRPVLTFAGAFLAGLVLHLAAAIPPARYLAVACDQISVVYVAAGLAYALAVAAVVMFGGRIGNPVLRFALMGAGGAAAAVVLVLVFPECRGGPYGQYSAEAAAVLLTNLAEAQPSWSWFARAIGGGSALLLLPLTGLIGAIAAAWFSRGDARNDWVVIAIFSLLLVAVTLLQVRGVRLAILPAVAVGGWVILQAWTWARQRPSISRWAIAALAAFAFAPIPQILAATALIPGGAKKAGPAATNYTRCVEGDVYAPLAALPRGRVLNYVFMSPQILYHTPHAVVATGYHRDDHGTADLVNFMSSEAGARRIAEERGLDYLVLCRGVPMEHGLYGVPAFAGVVDDQPQWSWLRPLSNPDDTVQVYAIDLTFR